MNPDSETLHKGTKAVLSGLKFKGSKMIFPIRTEQGLWYATIEGADIARCIKFEKRS